MNNNNFNVPPVIVTEISNQGKLILKGFGLQALKSKLFVIPDQTKLQDEKDGKAAGYDRAFNWNFGLPTFDVMTFNRMVSKDTGLVIQELSLGITLTDISQTKNIVTTTVAGRKGTVKEYISMGDYTINIKGVLVGNGQDIVPEDDIASIRDFLEAPQPLNVSSAILQRWSINTIVVTNFDIKQQEATRNVIPFEISALSDNPFELTQK